MLVGCTRAGAYALGGIGSAMGGVFPETQAIARLRVDGTVPTEMAVLPSELPGPPPYHADLRQARPQQRDFIVFGMPDGTDVVNGQLYPGPARPPMFGLSLGSVVEWSLVGGEAPSTLQRIHPYHQHLTPFQVVSVEWAGDSMNANASE